MLDSALLKQLNHPDPNKRKQAVMELAKTKDREALNYLATVYQSDKDPEVRELARKAGVYINKHADGGNSPYDDDDKYAAKTKYVDDYEPTDPGVYEEIEISPVNRERAAGLVKQALDIHMRGNNERAIKYLRDAIQRNPNLVHDSYTAGLAATIMGMPTDRAIRALISDKNKPVSDVKGKRGSTEPTWGDAIVDLVIYLLINMGIVALLLFVFAGPIISVLNEAILNSPSSTFTRSGTPVDPRVIINTLTGIGVATTLLLSAASALGSTIILIIQYFFIHMVSVSILNGEGTMPRLITKTTLPLALGYPAIYLVSFGFSYISIINPELYGLAAVVQFGLSIGMLFYISNRIGVAYRFSTWTGCGAIILSTIGMSLVFCVCSLLLPTLMMGMSGVPTR